jgi:Protein of unknown function (DUF2934)
MSGVLIGIPGSVQRNLPVEEFHDPKPVSAAQLSDCAAYADVAELAYTLWQERGCPLGSSETDWLRAEIQVRQRANAPALSQNP